MPQDDAARRKARLDRLRRVAGLMDRKWKVGPVPVGLDQLIGLVFGVGDAAGLVVSAGLIGATWHWFRPPRRLLLRMAWNVTLDAVAGTIPIVGDLFDFASQANLKNLELLERFLEEHPPGAGDSGRRPDG